MVEERIAGGALHFLFEFFCACVCNQLPFCSIFALLHLTSAKNQKKKDEDRAIFYDWNPVVKFLYFCICTFGQLPIPFIQHHMVCRWLIAGATVYQCLRIFDFMYARSFKDVIGLSFVYWVMEITLVNEKPVEVPDITFTKRITMFARHSVVMANQILGLAILLTIIHTIQHIPPAGLGVTLGFTDYLDADLQTFVSQITDWRMHVSIFLGGCSIYLMIGFYLEMGSAITYSFLSSRSGVSFKMRNPFAASSPRDLWSKRWKHSLSNIYKSVLFDPMRKVTHVGFAALFVFGASAAIHEFQNFVTFGMATGLYLPHDVREAQEKPPNGVVHAGHVSLFFLIHAVACVIETILYKIQSALGLPTTDSLPGPLKYIVDWIKIFVTLLFNYGTLCIFAMPYFAGGFFEITFETFHIPEYIVLLFRQAFDAALNFDLKTLQ